MSEIEVLTSTMVFVWILFVVVLFVFHRFIMTSNSTAGRGPTMEELVEAVRKAQARVDEVFAERPSTSAHGVLGVSSTASQDEIKAAYRRLAMKHHPDRGGSTDEFQKIKTAYEQLMKPTRCPQCEGKGTIRVKRGAFVDTVQCPRCWSTKEGEK